MATLATDIARSHTTRGVFRVILASAVGTLIEWYDFYIFGSLAAVLSPKFYPPGNDVFAYIAYLATFAVGFVVRPFGALFFGRIGDLAGRKHAFVVTLTIMGGATALLGMLPTYATAGWFSPIALLVIRVLQGLAIGGEYGGASVYVAEHVADNKRGFYTSFIQITAVLGFFISLLVILITRSRLSESSFQSWGWRIPFLLSLVLVTVSLYIRLKMGESPIFSAIKSAGLGSVQPLKEAFIKPENLKRVLVSLFGATAGQGALSYMGQFYVLFYLQTILKIELRTASMIVAMALLLGMPFLVLFGALSDKVGRKKIMMTGCLIAALTYVPVYKAMQRAAGNNVVAVSAAKNPVTRAIGLTPLSTDPMGNFVPAREAQAPNIPTLVFLVFLQVLYGSMVYGPIAAYLVEAFPARIRYTALSLPYHIGNGVFGGILPVVGLSVCAATGNIYAGLAYPVIVASITFIVGTLALPETHGTRIWAEVTASADSQ